MNNKKNKIARKIGALAIAIMGAIYFAAFIIYQFIESKTVLVILCGVAVIAILKIMIVVILMILNEEKEKP